MLDVSDYPREHDQFYTTNSDLGFADSSQILAILIGDRGISNYQPDNR